MTDDDAPAPTPKTDWDNDDDEPPAAGAVLIEEEDDEMEVSMAPTAEPTHRAEPEVVVIA